MSGAESPPPGVCVACGSARLVAHMRVSGAMGDEGLIPTTDSFGTALADIVRCLDCTHMQLEGFPADAVLEEAYGEAASDDYVDEEAGQRATAVSVLGEIERHSSRGELVDLGCWVGFLLDEARSRGWTVRGVEPSEFASSFARERFGLDVATSGLEEADLAESSVDAVFLGDVIEHLPDAAGALDRISSALRPDGVVAMALPDAGSRLARAMGPKWWSVLPTHVHYFTRRSIGTLLARRGFEPLSFTTSPKSFTVGYYLGRIGGYSPGLSGALVGAADRAGFADRLWAPDFGDRMLVVARATSPPPS